MAVSQDPPVALSVAPILVTSVSVDDFYFLLSRFFWALGGIDTITSWGPCHFMGPRGALSRSAGPSVPICLSVGIWDLSSVC